MGFPESRERHGPRRRRRLVVFTTAVAIAALALVAATLGLVAEGSAGLGLTPVASIHAGASDGPLIVAAPTNAPSTSLLLPSASTSVVAGVGSPDASSHAAPSVTPTTSLDPPPAPGPFAIDLYRPGSFVHEATPDMCIAAAMQTMLNIIGPSIDTTVATQQRLYRLARSLSPATLKGPGAEPEGWAKGLTTLGGGRYAVSVRGSMVNAAHAAARALRLTGRPVGLLAWYGAHSIVMSGFTATADPAWTDTFTVTAVSLEDVWYPSVSSIWGHSRPPDALVPIDRLARDFLPWRMPGGPYPDKAWKFVTIVPIVPET